MKKVYKSRTFWFNILAVLVFLAQSAGFADFAPNPGLMAATAAAFNLWLRYITSEPVTF